jgi:hypothetical protein
MFEQAEAPVAERCVTPSHEEILSRLAALEAELAPTRQVTPGAETAFELEEAVDPEVIVDLKDAELFEVAAAAQRQANWALSVQLKASPRSTLATRPRNPGPPIMHPIRGVGLGGARAPGHLRSARRAGDRRGDRPGVRDQRARWWVPAEPPPA